MLSLISKLILSPNSARCDEAKKIVQNYVFKSQSRFVVRNSQKRPDRELGLGYRGNIIVLYDTKLVLNEHQCSDPLNYLLRSIWYPSKPLEVPYSTNQFLERDFLCHSLQQTSSRLCRLLSKIIVSRLFKKILVSFQN